MCFGGRTGSTHCTASLMLHVGESNLLNIEILSFRERSSKYPVKYANFLFEEMAV